MLPEQALLHRTLDPAGYALAREMAIQDLATIALTAKRAILSKIRDRAPVIPLDRPEDVAAYAGAYRTITAGEMAERAGTSASGGGVNLFVQVNQAEIP